ncbi:type IV pilin protein [Halomonas ramblicola]|uniref:type IV pilin protein n=1 Tax=Halomonas ramblicola TaxID=747349 RepID=UPI0025B4EBFF|nr:type IV pilin protein [Halomonas ramblicola]MDN3521492.1 type IV pilin protein [Halomonas ramblicola]
MTEPSTRRRPRATPGSTRRSAGFTLIELMIAVAVVAILAAIAYPSYTRYVQEARRTDAMSALTNIAGQLERCYTVSSDYTDDGSGNACVSFSVTSEEGFYEITAPTLTTSTYTLQAAPQGAQSTDACGNFTLNHQGVRGAGGTDCW